MLWQVLYLLGSPFLFGFLSSIVFCLVCFSNLRKRIQRCFVVVWVVSYHVGINVVWILDSLDICREHNTLLLHHCLQCQCFHIPRLLLRWPLWCKMLVHFLFEFLGSLLFPDSHESIDLIFVNILIIYGSDGDFY